MAKKNKKSFDYKLMAIGAIAEIVIIIIGLAIYFYVN